MSSLNELNCQFCPRPVSHAPDSLSYNRQASIPFPPYNITILCCCRGMIFIILISSKNKSYFVAIFYTFIAIFVSHCFMQSVSSLFQFLIYACAKCLYYSAYFTISIIYLCCFLYLALMFSIFVNRTKAISACQNVRHRYTVIHSTRRNPVEISRFIRMLVLYVVGANSVKKLRRRQ